MPDRLLGRAAEPKMKTPWKSDWETDSKWTQYHQYGSSSSKLNIELPYDPAIVLQVLQVYTQENWKQRLRYSHTNVHSSIIHNCQKVEITKGSIKGWMDKQCVVYTYNGILFSLKKEGNSAICYNMNKPWGYYTKWSEPVTKGQILLWFNFMRYLEWSNS